MTLTLTTVTWAPVNAAGQALQDVSVTFTPAGDSVISGTFISAEPFTCRPGSGGTITADLVPGNYTAVITTGQQVTAWAVTIPASGSPVDLDTLLPDTPGSGGGGPVPGVAAETARAEAAEAAITASIPVTGWPQVAGRHDFTLITGTDFGRVLTWLDVSGNPVDLTGWSAHMQIRGWPGTVLYADLSTSGAGITLGGTAGTIALAIAAAATTGLPRCTARYDLLMTSALPATSCLLYGNVIIQEAVTA